MIQKVIHSGPPFRSVSFIHFYKKRKTSGPIFCNGIFFNVPNIVSDIEDFSGLCVPAPVICSGLYHSLSTITVGCWKYTSKVRYFITKHKFFIDTYSISNLVLWSWFWFGRWFRFRFRRRFLCYGFNNGILRVVRIRGIVTDTKANDNQSDYH